MPTPRHVPHCSWPAWAQTAQWRGCCRSYAYTSRRNERESCGSSWADSHRVVDGLQVSPGGCQKKNSWYHPGIFFSGGYPKRGRGVQKISAKIFARPPKRRFLEIYPTPLNFEGANRILFNVSTDILTDMGGICGLIPRSDHAYFQDATLCGCITPALSGAQKWAELLRNPCVRGGPQERGQNQSTAQPKKMGKVICLCAPTHVGVPPHCPQQDLNPGCGNCSTAALPLRYKPTLTALCSGMMDMFFIHY